MTQAPMQPVTRAKPQSNIYTLLIIIAVVVLGATIGISMYRLMAQPPQGYGLSFGQLFERIVP